MNERRRGWPQAWLRVGLLPLSLIAAAGCTRTSPPPDARTYRVNSAAILLEMHNRERLAVGSPLLRWDPALAADAAGYAAYLAARGALRHSARWQRPGQGENLWIGARGAFPVQAMARAWLAERADFRAGIFPAVSGTGNWADVGHYSQMIWPTTTRLGCAIAGGPRHDVLVCRYAPAGNIDGRPVP